MGKLSLTERYARKLDGEADELLGDEPDLSPVHAQTLDVMLDLLSIAKRSSSGETPAAMRTLMVMMDRMRPTLTDSLRNVPADAIVEFMADLRDRIDSIVQKGGDSDGGESRPAVAALES